MSNEDELIGKVNSSDSSNKKTWFSNSKRRIAALGTAISMLATIPLVAADRDVEKEVVKAFQTRPVTAEQQKEVPTLRVRRPSGRRMAPIDPNAATQIRILDVESSEDYKTKIVTINGSYNEENLVLTGREPRLGFRRAREYVTLPGNGSLSSLLSTIFSHPEKIFMLDIGSRDKIYGKITAEEFITSRDGRMSSGYSFNSHSEPKHLLTAPYIDANASWRAARFMNDGTRGIDIYKVNYDGTKELIAPNLGVGRQFVYDMSELSDTHARFEATIGSTDIPIDALRGKIEFAHDDGYGKMAGYNMKGSDVSGEKSGFSSKFFMPVWNFYEMQKFYRETDGWQVFSYFNPTDRRQRVYFTHYLPNGDRQVISKFTVDARTQYASSLENLGIDRVGGGIVEFRVDDYYLGTPSNGDLVTLMGDMPDEIGSSILGAVHVPTEEEKSKYMRFSAMNTQNRSTVLHFMNTSEEEAELGVTLHQGSGVAIAPEYDGDIILAPNGSFTIDMADFSVLGFDGTGYAVSSNPGIVGTAIHYNVTPVRDRQQVSAVPMEAVNNPASEFELDSLDCVNGEYNECFAIAGNPFVALVNWRQSGGVDGARRVELYLDDVLVDERDYEEGAFTGTLGVSTEFNDNNNHALEIRVKADDGNEIEDFREKYRIFVLSDAIEATFKYYDENHNPTDTLEVNKPFYVEYDVKRNDDEDIAQIRLIVTPQNGTGDDKLIRNLSGTHVQGEVYVQNGIATNTQDGLHDQVVTPEVNVWNSDFRSKNAETIDSEYNLPAERVYDDIDNYYQLTENNIEELAEIFSRDGVLIGCTTQFDYDDMLNGLQNILSSGIFDGITINDYQNRFYIHYNDGTPSRVITLGDQTYFAEQNIDDLKDVYQVD